jgi:protein ImuB
MFACLYRPPYADASSLAAEGRQARHGREEPDGSQTQLLVSIAEGFSPRYERHRDDLVSIDVSGLGRLLGPAATIGEELRRAAAARSARVHVALAGTQTAALLLAQARPGLTLVEPGAPVAAAIASLPIEILEHWMLEHASAAMPVETRARRPARTDTAAKVLSALRTWGIHTLGELAALPAADLASRLGQPALLWQAIARGEDIRPLIPTLPDERFVSSLDLEWPIEGPEPLSFVLTRLLEPLSTRLERRDRGAAVLHVELGLVTRAIDVRRLQLPSPLREVRALRTLALLDLDARPPAAAIDRVTIVIDPTPGRVLQHTLFTRAHPTAEQLSTLLARLGALMGQDRIGAPAVVDSDRPGAFAVAPFATEHASRLGHAVPPAHAHGEDDGAPRPPLVSALRRCRQPVPARVATDGSRPLRVTSDRHAFAGGQVLASAGPWRTSGEWWRTSAGGGGGTGEAGRAGRAERASSAGGTGRAGEAGMAGWDRDEWEVALTDGAVYRIFRDRETDGWFIDAIVD